MQNLVEFLLKGVHIENIHYMWQRGKVREVGSNCFSNLESETVIYDVSRERLTTFSLFILTFALVVMPKVS